MALRAVCLGALLCAFPLAACGERAGDPVVRLESDEADAGQPGAPPTSGAGGSGPGADATVGPTGPCGACLSSEECGDANDACIRHEGESFCGRDCGEGFGCPDGYDCVELANSRLEQCIPSSSCPEPATTPPPLDEIRAYLLLRINAERLDRNRAPLQAMTCLDGLAQQSAVAYARSDEPLGKFVKECDPIWPNCSCGWSAEAEVAVAHIGLDWLGAIDRAMGSSRDGESFVESFLDFEVSHVGIGFWISGDEAWIALSFA